MKKLFLLIIFVFFYTDAFAFFGMEDKYQHDADIFRMRHLKYYGDLLNEFFAKTGRYPLQDKSEHQNYVHIAAPHQEKYVQGGPPYQHTVTPIQDFRSELESGLGRKVDLKFDPQKVPESAPCFYIYMIIEDKYFFASHLYNEYSFSNPIGKHYNKVEITNSGLSRRGLWDFKNLLTNEDFIKALNGKPYKNAWFLKLEEKYK